ncbi:MAG: hypothetical protein L6R42_004618, partial [Xanthoria sp. 1 TBL-2021]
LSAAVKSPDVTWDIAANVAWRLPEVNIGIVCANVPALRPVYLYFQGRLASQQSNSRTAYSRDKMMNSSARRKGQGDLENGNSNVTSGSVGTAETAVSYEMGIVGLSKDSR